MRKYLLLILVIGSGICLIGRLFFLQVLDSGANTLENDNAIRKIYQYPKRGYISVSYTHLTLPTKRIV